MVGTGPFKMVSYAPERELVLAANENYWDVGRPKVDELVIRYIPEQQAQLAALQAGEIDIMFPGPETVLALAGNSDITVQEVVSANVIRLNVNSAKPPLDIVDVRRALNLGIDRQGNRRWCPVRQRLPVLVHPSGVWMVDSGVRSCVLAA